MKIELNLPELDRIVFDAVTKALQAQAKPASQTATSESLLTMKALCLELSLSRTRVNQLIRSKTLKAHRLPGSRRIFFKRSEIISAMSGKVKREGIS